MRANNSISTLPIANMTQQHFTQAQVAHNRLLAAQIANLKDVTRKFELLVSFWVSQAGAIDSLLSDLAVPDS